MKYDEARALIRTGDLIALRQVHGIAPAMIRLVTGSPYTHTSVAIWCGGRLLVNETQASGACLRPLSNYDNEAFDVIPCPIDRGEVEAAMWELLGRKIKYDLADLARIAANRLFGIPLPKREDDALICSSLSATIWMRAGWRGRSLPSIPAPDDVVREAGTVMIEVRPCRP